MKGTKLQKDTMKNSGVEWIGDIPGGWEVKRGKFLFRSKKEINSQMQCDNVLSLTMQGVISRSELGEGGLLPSDYSTFQVFYKDDLVFKLIDLENYKTSRVGIVHEKGIMSSAYIRAFPIQNKNLIEKFFFYFYFNLYLQGIFNFIGMGVRSTMNAKDLLEMNVIIPPEETQKEIADFLDEKTEKVDKVIEKKKKLIELLKEKHSSLITHTVTKGLDPNAKIKDSGVEWIGEIPEGWEVEPLKTFFRFKKDSKAQQYTREYIFSNQGDYPVYSGQTENEGVMGKMATYNFDVDEVIFVSTVGAKAMTPYIIRGKFSLSQNCLIMIPNRKIPVPYFYYQMLPLFKYEKESIPSHMQPSLRQSDLNSYKVVVPSKETQKEIADFLDEKTEQIDKAVEKIQYQINKLQEYRSSLIYHAVTGKIKI